MITGAGSGFGRGAAVELARRGHDVIATTYDEAQAQELAAAEPSLTVHKLDITNAEDRDLARGWDVDVLIDNAGAGQLGTLLQIPLDLVRQVFEVNVFGTLAITQVVAEGMVRRRSGRIVIVSSIAGLLTDAASGPYSMTKHALQAMGAALRLELEPYGVDVCLLNPGPFATGFNDAMANDPGGWFDDVSQVEKDMLASLGKLITTDQLDPNQVVTTMADLAEAEATELQNLVPPNIMELITGG